MALQFIMFNLFLKWFISTLKWNNRNSEEVSNVPKVSQQVDPDTRFPVWEQSPCMLLVAFND